MNLVWLLPRHNCCSALSRKTERTVVLRSYLFFLLVLNNPFHEKLCKYIQKKSELHYKLDDDFVLSSQCQIQVSYKAKVCLPQLQTNTDSETIRTKIATVNQTRGSTSCWWPKWKKKTKVWKANPSTLQNSLLVPAAGSSGISWATSNACSKAVLNPELPFRTIGKFKKKKSKGAEAISAQ